MAVIALRLAAEKPALVRSLSLHDPALFRMFSEEAPNESSDDSDSGLQKVVDLIAAGQTEAGAQYFVEAVIVIRMPVGSIFNDSRISKRRRC